MKDVAQKETRSGRMDRTISIRCSSLQVPSHSPDIYIYMLPLFVSLKKDYDRNVVSKYRMYLLLGVITFNLIDYIYIYILVFDIDV